MIQEVRQIFISDRAREYVENVPVLEVNSDGHTFAQYLSLAEQYCIRRIGLSIFDLADAPWYNYWSEAVHHKEAVFELLEEEGFLDEEDSE